MKFRQTDQLKKGNKTSASENDGWKMTILTDGLRL